MPDADHPVLSEQAVRSIVGAGARIYLIDSPRCLRLLSGMLGDLALERGDVRVFWPGFVPGYDPGDHPLMSLVPYADAGADNPSAELLDEFALRFDASRPRVRAQLKLLYVAHAVLERELARAQEALMHAEERAHDAEMRCRREAARANRAEEKLFGAEAALEANAQGETPDGHDHQADIR
jgi:hypothetical protein